MHENDSYPMEQYATPTEMAMQKRIDGLVAELADARGERDAYRDSMQQHHEQAVKATELYEAAQPLAEAVRRWYANPQAFPLARLMDAARADACRGGDDG